jgi:hypothetical protein
MSAIDVDVDLSNLLMFEWLGLASTSFESAEMTTTCQTLHPRTRIFMEQQRWCIFTSAGDHNAIRLWVESGAPRRWDLVVGYYGVNDDEFSQIGMMSSYSFRANGGKFQILKEFVVQNPRFFDQYSYVWVCDDDIQMSAQHIDEAFAIAEFFKFWVAQPSFLPEGKISHRITRYAGPQCDYKIVNFIEENVPIFRRDKLAEFLTAYDGSLPGWGIDHWYMNVFRANELGRVTNFFRKNNLARFGIIDKVQVINPHDEEKGGNELDRLQPLSLRQAAWRKAKAKYNLVEIHPAAFARRKISSRNAEVAVTRYELARQVAILPAQKFVRAWIPARLSRLFGRRAII